MKKAYSRSRMRDEAEISAELRRLFSDLSSSGALVVVEGRNDVRAIRALGYSGKAFQFCGAGGGIKNLIEVSTSFSKLVIMFDKDQTGLKLSKKIVAAFRNSGVELDFSVWAKVAQLTGLKHVEDLIRFAREDGLGLPLDVLKVAVDDGE